MVESGVVPGAWNRSTAEHLARWAAKRIVNARLYDELAESWPLIADPDDYRAAAIEYTRLLTLHGSPKRILELGSGGGSNAFFLKSRFELTLVDVSPRMLEVSRISNPQCVHLEGDMRTVRLDRVFDAVFIENALGYMTTREYLLRALETAFAHCRPGGTCLLVPDHFRETFRPGVSTGGCDQDERSLRYLEWSYDSDPADTLVETDLALLLRVGSRPIEVVHDHHTTGLFESEVWLDLCRRAGFQPEIHAIRILENPVETIVCTRAS